MKLMRSLPSLIVLIVFVSACRQDSKSESAESLNPFINPPLPGINVAFERYTVSADSGGLLLTASGSVLDFPPSAFLDAEGKVVSGHVDINYREFSDPIDFFVSGIPMSYDSSGVSYTFESAGMFEIQAHRSGQPVFVNPASRPSVHYLSQNADPEQRTYQLDTVQRRWKFEGANLITVIEGDGHADKGSRVDEKNSDATEDAPLKPNKASDDRLTFSINIEPGSVPELEAYNNLLFEFADPSKVNPDDNREEWQKVNIARTAKRGLYKVTFSRPGRTVSYEAKPVFKGKSYDEAIALFNKKDREYREMRARRKAETELAARKVQADEEALAQENARVERMNRIIEARNKDLLARQEAMRRKNTRIDSINTRRRKERDSLEDERLKAFNNDRQNTLENNFDLDRFRAAIEEEFERRRPVDTYLYRTFNLAGFGVWNCDYPRLLSSIRIRARFFDEAGSLLLFNRVNVVFKEFNGVVVMDDVLKDGQFPSMPIMPGREHMLWAVLDNHLYYLTYADFSGYGLSASSKEVNFRLRACGDSIVDLEDVKKCISL